MTFYDREDAGRCLARLLTHLTGTEPVVVGLARGGVPVAAQVAAALNAPLDVLVVRKLGVPFQPELGMGAIAEGGVRVVNERVTRPAHVSPEDLAAVEAREHSELERQARRLRGDRPPVHLLGRTVVVVDDGLATGSTASAACRAARAAGAGRVVLAVPVAPPEAVDSLRGDADDIVCVEQPERFFAVGAHYTDFSQTSDEQVADLLDRAAARGGRAVDPGRAGSPQPPSAAARGAVVPPDPEVEVEAGPLRLAGQLTLPVAATGVVVFAHGSGSSRHSPRNRLVATELNLAGLGTLLFDLLTPAEELDRANVFDIGLLAHRLAEATAWLRGQPGTADLPTGYFGASTGAAAALWAAAAPGANIGAVVSRGGRPDLAAPKLAAVRAPTLLIVGSEDHLVLELNARAAAVLRCESRLEVVPGATHLFAEPGALDLVAALARDWFAGHLAPAASRGG